MFTGLSRFVVWLLLLAIWLNSSARAALPRLKVSDNERFLANSKGHADDGEIVLVVVNLDPLHAQETVLRLDLGALGLPSANVVAVDELGGATYQWSTDPYVRLDPSADQVAHILTLRPA